MTFSGVSSMSNILKAPLFPGIRRWPRFRGRYIELYDILILTSRALRPLGYANTGLISNSAISGKSLHSCATRPIASSRAGMSSGAAPRKPFKMVYALSLLDHLRNLGTGGRLASLKEASFKRFTSTPPEPNAIMGPNVGSLAIPIMISSPLGIIFWTSTP